MELKVNYEINEKDAVICLISGGGSSLLSAPVDEISLKEKKITTELLIKSGASINEINVVRKHISKIKGGQLAQRFSPAKIITIIISDVIGDKLDVIASGPTVPDPSTFNDAYAVLKDHSLLDKVPESVKNYIVNGSKGEYKETPKELNSCTYHVLGNNITALEAMAVKARSLGRKPIIVTSELAGQPDVVAQMVVEEISKGDYDNYDTLIMGGETSPIVPRGHGKGGRNLHYVASTLGSQKWSGEWAMSSIDTDGADYIDEAAGAVIDNNTLALAMAKNMDHESYLKNFDTYEFFSKLGGSIVKTGFTGTNVGDILIYLFNKG